MESPFSTPSCPCCAFLSGGNLFLPWNEEGEVDIKDIGQIDSGGLTLSAEDIFTPKEAWERIVALRNPSDDADETKQQILLVDTHGHPHLQREVQYADEDSASASELKCSSSSDGVILPALGVHPWYLGDILVDIERAGICEDIEQYLQWEWLAELETHLSEHPHLLVGEIGLCKMARFVREFPKDKGTAYHVGEILAFEKELLYPEEAQAEGKRRRRKQQRQTEATEPDADGSEDGPKEMLFYFGFSHAVNHIMCTSQKARKKGMEAVRSIPRDRLLVESDVHASVDVALGTAGAAAYAAQVRGETLEDVAEYTTKNGLRYLSSLGSLAND
ncbi:hypothetical protein ACHAXT_007387 [Thalassiosira profunda]